MQLDVEGVAPQVALQLDEVIAAAQRAELRHAAFRSPRTAPRRLPGVVDGEAVPFSPRPVHALAIVLRIVSGAATDDRLELVLRQVFEACAADLAGSKCDSACDLPIEAQPILRRRRAYRHATRGAHHSAANVEADGTHGHGARLSIRQEHGADGHAVAVVNVGRDRHQLDAGKAGRIHDLGINGLLDLVEQVGREEQAYRHRPDFLRVQRVITLS